MSRVHPFAHDRSLFSTRQCSSEDLHCRNWTMCSVFVVDVVDESSRLSAMFFWEAAENRRLMCDNHLHTVWVSCQQIQCHYGTRRTAKHRCCGLLPVFRRQMLDQTLCIVCVRGEPVCEVLGASEDAAGIASSVPAD